MPLYQMPRPVLPIGGASAAPPASQPYPVSQPDQARYRQLQAPRFLVDAPKRFDGATVHQSYLFATGQPQTRLKYQIPRVRVPIDVTVAPVVQNNVFTTLQPELARFAQLQAWRFIVPAPARVHEGAAALAPQTYVFPLVQHYDVRQYARRPIVGAPERPHEGAAPAVPQTYIFPLAQPELRAWLRFDANRVPGGPTRQTTGPTIHQSYVFVPNQPDQIRWAIPQDARRLGGSVAWPLDTFAQTYVTSTISLSGSSSALIQLRGES